MSAVNTFNAGVLLPQVSAIYAKSELEKIEAEERKERTALRRATQTGDEIWDAFNNSFPISQFLEDAGYEQDGDNWRHPKSESGSFSGSTRIEPTTGKEQYNTRSSSDPLYNDGKRASDTFGVFTVLCHDNDRNAAKRAAGDMLNAEGGVLIEGQTSWNTKILTEGLQDLDRVDYESLHAFVKPICAYTDARDGTATTRPLSELGNAERLFDRYGDYIRYIYDAKYWLHWSKGAWLTDKDGSRMRAKAGELPKQIYAEGNLHLHDSEWFAKWSRISQKERTINASLSLLSSNFQEIRLPIRLVDSDPFLVGFDNARQVIDLKTGEARPAKPEDLVTKSLQVYDLGDSKKAVRWTSFLEQIFENDQELIQWLKRWCGYLLTGSTREQVFMFCYGLGDNGKSVFAKLLSYIMGDYARTVASEALTESKRAAGAASPDIITLIGARLALSSESVAEAALNEAQIKLMTGGDTMSARDLYTGICEFDPNFKLMMLGNHKPIIRGNDHGIWRRVRLIPFNRTFTESEKDLSLVDKLKLEAPHILAWMVEGCIDWQKVGLSGVPKKVGNATKDYRTEQDVIGEWLTDNCEFGEGKEATATALYNCYKTWALENGLRPVSNVTLGRRLAERGGLEKKRSNSGSIWSGIGITDVKDTLHLDWDNTNNIDSII